TSRMTELEREWRMLSRSDPDGELMNLWARVAPSSWIDRKRWRDAAPAARLDVVVALASDAEGVDTGAAAVDALRLALTEWEVPVGARTRWRPFEEDFDGVPELLAKPLRAASEALSRHDWETVALERAHHLERDVHEAALARFPERAHLARALAF